MVHGLCSELGHVRGGVESAKLGVEVVVTFGLLAGGFWHVECRLHVCHALPHSHNHRLAVIPLWHVPAHHVYFHLAMSMSFVGCVHLVCPQFGQVMVI